MLWPSLIAETHQISSGEVQTGKARDNCRVRQLKGEVHLFKICRHSRGLGEGKTRHNHRDLTSGDLGIRLNSSIGECAPVEGMGKVLVIEQLAG